jgi:hypothetical protein
VSATTTRNFLGYLRRYSDGSELQPFHVEQKPQPTDRERCDLVAADREVCALLTLAEHLEVSDIGFSRILEALGIIQRALNAKRLRLGMSRSVHAVSYVDAVAAVHAALGLDQQQQRRETA